MLNAASTTKHYLTSLSPKDKPWDKHRAEAGTVANLYRVRYSRYASRMEDCSRRLQFSLVNAGDAMTLRLDAARFCRVRHCPVCQWRRSMMWRARFFDALPHVLHDHPKLIPVFVTLTVKNCQVSELRSQIQEMNLGWGRLTKRVQWPALGWVKSLEVTRNAFTGEAHPHFHVLMFVRPGYFSKNYIKQADWREMWRSALQVDYLPVVNIKRVKPAPGQTKEQGIRIAILETLKYSVKPDDLAGNGEWLYAITEQLHKTRAVAVGGILRDYLRDSDPEDLIHDESVDSGELEQMTPPHVVFDWHDLAKRYAMNYTPDV